MKNWILPLVLIISTRIVAQEKPVPSGVYKWDEVSVKKSDQRETRKILEGTTPEFSYFEIHATTQEKGATPRPPHTQKDLEELIIIKEGRLKCRIGDKVSVLGPGGVIMIPPGVSQAFENVGDGPVSYFVLMFRSRKLMDNERAANAGGALLLNYDSLTYTEKDNRGTRKYFDRATAMCERYEMHVTTLKLKGPSHAPHQHVETEILMIIKGYADMTIDGKEYSAGPGDFFLAESGTMHGIRNATDKPCEYFAFKWR